MNPAIAPHTAGQMADLAQNVRLFSKPTAWINWWDQIENTTADIDTGAMEWLVFFGILENRLTAAFDAPLGVHSDIRMLIDTMYRPRVRQYIAHFEQALAEGQ